MSISLRPADESDLPAIVALMNAAFRTVGEGRSWNTEAGYITGDRTDASLLREEIAHGAQFLIVKSSKASTLEGCVSLKPISPDRWYLGSLAIDPALQNQGLGGRLLEATEAYAAARGVSEIEMTVVHVRDTLIAWYERKGYRRTGELRPFPYGDHRVGTPLRDDLAFVVLEKHLEA